MHVHITFEKDTQVHNDCNIVYGWDGGTNLLLFGSHHDWNWVQQAMKLAGVSHDIIKRVRMRAWMSESLNLSNVLNTFKYTDNILRGIKWALFHKSTISLSARADPILKNGPNFHVELPRVPLIHISDGHGCQWTLSNKTNIVPRSRLINRCMYAYWWCYITWCKWWYTVHDMHVQCNMCNIVLNCNLTICSCKMNSIYIPGLYICDK